MLAGLDNNSVIQFLGNNDIGVQYLQDTVMFLFCLGVVNGVGKKGLVTTFGTSFLRAFGDVNIALALGLGGVAGSSAFRNLDQTMMLLCAAIFWSWYCDEHVPAEFAKYWGWGQDLSWSIVKANNAAVGYAAAGAACPGSFWAPLFGAWVGCNGARMIESGFGAVSKKWDANDLLAATSGLFLFVATTHLQASALTARALLAAWSFSGNWIDWQRKFNDIAAGSKKE